MPDREQTESREVNREHVPHMERKQPVALRFQAMRRRIKSNPTVTALIALFSILGSVFHLAKEALDWVSRYDTWNAHVNAAVEAAALLAARVPPGTSEVCYIIAVVLVVLFFNRHDDHAQPEAAPVIPPPRSINAFDFLKAREMEDLKRRRDKRRRDRAETELAEERLRDLRAGKSKLTTSTDPPPLRNSAQENTTDHAETAAHLEIARGVAFVSVASRIALIEELELRGGTPESCAEDLVRIFRKYRCSQITYRGKNAALIAALRANGYKPIELSY